MVPVNSTIKEQLDFVKKAVITNPNLKEILFSKPFDGSETWYLGAGCINQTVWNYISKREITYGIGDYDLVYYDEDISKQCEIKHQSRVNQKYKNLSIEIEVVNQARVHTWYKKDFGVEIQQYKSVEEGVNSWPTTATAIGATVKNGELRIYAPYGLNDLLQMKLRINSSTTIPKEFIPAKIKKWTKKWPELEVVG